MGQRSQIYIRYNGGKNIVAYHLQWNWGEHMINRANQLLEFISKNVKDTFSELLESGYQQERAKEFLSGLIQMNLTIGSYVKGVDLVAEEYEMALYDKHMLIDTFCINPNNQDNNDGFLVIDIDEIKKGDKTIPKIYASIWNGTYEKVSFENYAKKYMENALDYYDDLVNRGGIDFKDYEEEKEMWCKIIKKAQKLDKKYKRIDSDRYAKIFNTDYKYEDNLTEKDMLYLDILNERRKKGVI